MNNLDVEIFSQEYDSSENTSVEDNQFEKTINKEKEILDAEQTKVDSKEYIISKPQRIIIKATIKND